MINETIGSNSPNYKFSCKIKVKILEKHDVSQKEVRECFKNNPDNLFLLDLREEHKTNPPTVWFLSETNQGRMLKVCYIYSKEYNTFFIKTSFEPNSDEIRIFNKYA